jgi:hypothetical protein
MLTVIVPEDIPMEDAKALVIYWQEKYCSATKVDIKLLARAGEACPAYSTITNCIRALTRGEDIGGHASGGGHLLDDRVDTLVTNTLEESPFHSVRSLASAIKIPSNNSMATFARQGLCSAKPAHRSPHSILGSESGPGRIGNRIEKSAVLGETLWGSHILTGDESWLYFPINPDHAWVPEGVVTQTRSKQTINSPKRMLTVFSSTLGSPLVQILPEGHRFNTEYFYNHILHEIDQIRPATTDEDARRKVVLHFDNATPHTAAVSLAFGDSYRMRISPQPPFSPDLTRPDFYLFGKRKTTLMRSVFENEHELLIGIMRALDKITRDELESVLDEWVARLDVCIHRCGDYVE